MLYNESIPLHTLAKLSGSSAQCDLLIPLVAILNLSLHISTACSRPSAKDRDLWNWDF